MSCRGGPSLEPPEQNRSDEEQKERRSNSFPFQATGLMSFFASFAVLCELSAKRNPLEKERYVGAMLAKDRKARKADVTP